MLISKLEMFFTLSPLDFAKVFKSLHPSCIVRIGEVCLMD